MSFNKDLKYSYYNCTLQTTKPQLFIFNIPPIFYIVYNTQHLYSVFIIFMAIKLYIFYRQETRNKHYIHSPSASLSLNPPNYILVLLVVYKNIIHFYYLSILLKVEK